jgi:hypothetical protein
MNEKDIEYLRNINTSPGPNAGRSIDPMKPQIEDAPKATPFIPTWEDPQSDAEPVAVTAARKRIRECASWHDCQQCSNDEKLISDYESTLTDAEPGPADEDVRAETAAYRIKAECFDWDGSFSAERAYHIICAAIAQPDAEPDYERAWNQAQDRIAKLEAAQSDAEPGRCPIGIPPESHNICSAGTCWWCLADRVKAQSNAEPPGLLHNTGGGFKEVVTRDTAAIYDNDPQPRLVEEIFDFDHKLIGFRVYDAPPRPDASAGLIEAAEIVYAKWDKLSDSDPKACGDMWELYNEIRARAADRSGK